MRSVLWVFVLLLLAGCASSIDHNPTDCETPAADEILVKGEFYTDHADWLRVSSVGDLLGREIYLIRSDSMQANIYELQHKVLTLLVRSYPACDFGFTLGCLHEGSDGYIYEIVNWCNIEERSDNATLFLQSRQLGVSKSQV